jgi:hypothetical protein
MAKIKHGTIFGPYSTNCECKYHYFPEIRAAKIHCNNCDKATEVAYRSPYAKDRIVYRKGE